MPSSNNEYNNKAWLDQTWTIIINSDHNDHSHKEWTFKHAGSYAQCKVSFACPTLNQCKTLR